uniref:tRNA/rRNA methyltransferase SpoU type domain-containing protein n=1 Tax=Chromera velia CCMP2878 TaxID=1169474 RepID=A0A0G4HU07_9ALVE|eukprot:Cvel_8567.t1-p1 / transcript=Cvel_8567.t1 / gene=Cvel_8567 / organism=Chromera_velia_CCMP2878 / gene_product=Putative tRNA/rRNA methyltransferase BB_0052, putative / transcript_product=Putative tRNA/rRNA methyltransferase BB_0052, putative / location=Cvel_scaffold475:57916-60890(-) / protein_length=533 / sequence_SO=supercontig / SO=protein_coding / is_pseudo=false
MGCSQRSPSPSSLFSSLSFLALSLSLSRTTASPTPPSYSPSRNAIRPPSFLPRAPPPVLPPVSRHRQEREQSRFAPQYSQSVLHQQSKRLYDAKYPYGHKDAEEEDTWGSWEWGAVRFGEERSPKKMRTNMTEARTWNQSPDAGGDKGGASDTQTQSEKKGTSVAGSGEDTIGSGKSRALSGLLRSEEAMERLRKGIRETSGGNLSKQLHITHKESLKVAYEGDTNERRLMLREIRKFDYRQAVDRLFDPHPNTLSLSHQIHSSSTSQVEPGGGRGNGREGEELVSGELMEACRAIAPRVTPHKVQRFVEVARLRTHYARFVFERPCNPNNVWAALRTLDSFGVQRADLIATRGDYSRRNLRGAMTAALGSSKWLSLRQHETTMGCVERLKEEGYRVYASDLSESAVCLSDLDISRPFAVVMGSELKGITDEMRQAADATFFIPMKGFAESLNLSVACAVILTQLDLRGGLKPGCMTEEDRAMLLFRWLSGQLPETGWSEVLAQEGVKLSRLTEERIEGEQIKRQLLGYKTGT